MNVSLTPELEAPVRRKVETGDYNSASEVVREALQLLDERDRLKRLRAAIAIGDAQLARGEGIPYTSELLDEIDRDVDERLLRGEQPWPDAGP
jgi:antitoxin ParD1/3/4